MQEEFSVFKIPNFIREEAATFAVVDEFELYQELTAISEEIE